MNPIDSLPVFWLADPDVTPLGTVGSAAENFPVYIDLPETGRFVAYVATDDLKLQTPGARVT